METEPRGSNIDAIQGRITDIYDGLPIRVKDYLKRDKQLQDPELPDDKRALYAAQREQLYDQIQETPMLMEGLSTFAQAVAELAYEKARLGIE